MCVPAPITTIHYGSNITTIIGVAQANEYPSYFIAHALILYKHHHLDLQKTFFFHIFCFFFQIQILVLQYTAGNWCFLYIL